MSMRECPSCAVDVPADSELCPLCGYEFPQGPKSWVRMTGLALVALSIYPIWRMIMHFLDYYFR